MIVTNKKGLPEVFVNLAKRAYKGSDNYSASSLTKSPRQVWLERRHRNEVEVDVIDTLWALMGGAVHSALEKGQEEDALTEQYIKTPLGGSFLTGMADHYKDGVVSDYKFTSVWTWVYKSSYEDYKIQLNAYKYLYETMDFKVNRLQVVFIFRDWDKRKSTDEGYPDAPVMVQDFPIMNNIQNIIIQKISICEQYRNTPDDELPLCTDEERWARPSTWAVMKDGRKTAVRVLPTEEEALNYITQKNLDDKHFATERKGDQYVRCEYCSGRQFCNQYNQGL